jgi:ribosome biogenesis GTPase / thiamine phosphate phosphatase
VLFEETDEPRNGIIYSILPRRNYIIRKSVKLSRQAHIIAANVDKAFLIISLVAPSTSLGFIDRFLVTCEAYNVPAAVIINKTDLYEPDLLEYGRELKGVYEPLGYQCFFVSATEGKGIAELRSVLEKGVNLFSGQSGVGKSTLINTLEPKLNLKTGEISIQHLKGTHTTTFAEMHRLPSSGFIIDTPGIRDFGIIDLEKAEISHFFPEMRSRLNECQFNNCLHEHEPGCMIKKAVENGEIYYQRYHNYLSILHNEDRFN